MSLKKISDLAAASSIVEASALLELEQSNLTAGERSTRISMADLLDRVSPAGEVKAFAMATAPDNFLECDGSPVSRTTYARLFTAIGTTWGSGDGSTTFNVPDLRGAFVRGTGSHGSKTMADGNAFAGPSVGSFQNDRMQGHQHPYALNSAGGSRRGLETAIGGYSKVLSTDNSNPLNNAIGSPVEDNANGTPRTGDETRPFAAGVLYCIRY